MISTKVLAVTESFVGVTKLSEHKRWSSLLHYRTSIWRETKSEIYSPDFFLSPNGRTSLVDELDATIKAMNAPMGANPNHHAQCRFPARAIWLKKMIPDVAKFWPVVTCPDYLSYSKKGKIESVSMIFATGYLSNPASYFGHPLIKFNLPQSKMPNHLLDTSINFGAITPQNENPFVYAGKGLFGGYDATFTHRTFYYNNHSYGEVELRDMWEYRLNLTPEEVEYFYAHIWEVIGKKFPYYFFSENCATAAARLIEDIVDQKLMPAFLPYSLPYTFFDRIAETKRNDGKPLVHSVTLIPSRQSRLTANYNSLNDEQKDVVNKIARGSRVSDSLITLPNEDRARAIETLMDYYSFRALQARDENKIDEPYADIKRELLAERLKMPIDPKLSSLSYPLSPPHSGPRPFLIRMGAVNSMKFGTGTELQFRASYYDFLSLNLGRPPNSEVRTFDATFNYIDHAFWMRKLDLISVSTLNLSQTGLPGDGGWAWRFTTGFESLSLACRDCNLFKIEAGIGRALRLQDRQILFAILDIRGQTPTGGSGQLAATPIAGALINWFSSGLIKTEISWGYRSYFERQDADAEIIKLENRFGLSRHWDLRATYEKHEDEWYRLAFSWYL